MHRELKRGHRPSASGPPARQQRRSDRWRRITTPSVRMKALGGRYPADRYRHSRRRYRGPQPIGYRRGWVVRHVRHNGQIKWQGRMRSIGEAFVGQPVPCVAKPQASTKSIFSGSCWHSSRPRCRWHSPLQTAPLENLISYRCLPCLCPLFTHVYAPCREGGRYLAHIPFRLAQPVCFLRQSAAGASE